MAMLTIEFDLSARNPLVRGHVVGGTAVLPGMAYPDLILQVFARYGYPWAELELRKLVIYEPLTVTGDQVVAVRVLAEPAGTDSWRVRVEGRSGTAQEPVTRYASAEAHQVGPAVLDEPLGPLPPAVADLATVYRRCQLAGLVHSGAMRAEGMVHREGAELVADVCLPEEAMSDATRFLVHPTLLDAAVVAAAVLSAADADGAGLYLPVSIGSLRVVTPISGGCRARLLRTDQPDRNGLRWLSLELFDDAGCKVGELRDVVSRQVRIQSSVTRTTLDVAGRTEVIAALRELLGRRLGQPPDEVDPELGFHEQGLESKHLLALVEQLEQRFGRALSPTLLFEYPTIAALADWLVPRLPAAERPQPRPEPESVPGPARVQVRSTEPAAERDLAVVGLSGRYPAAYDLAEFWANLRDGRDCVTEVPADRWNWREYHSEQPAEFGHITSRWGGFIDDADKFDPLFFRVSPREALAMDPLERLFLQHCWAALEDAGHTPANLIRDSDPAGGGEPIARVGVYASVMFSEYSLFAAEAAAAGIRLGLASGGASIANRVSYFCGFHGPSMTVDTACSGSLTALHLAGTALRAGEIDAALVGGVNLSIHPNKYLTLSQGNFLSSKGRCEAFGAGGDGYIPGEGVGVLFLRRLRDAELDSDHIYGVIRGTAINHGGRASGYTVPNPSAQRRVVAAALRDAGVSPSTIGYVEAHGTGTKLGDPIELAGLSAVFDADSQGVPRQSCAIGSVKSNIGHCEAAAGVAGVTKVLLQFEHGKLVPSLHADPPNAEIDFPATPFVLNQELRPWPRPVRDGRELPRRAGVSSFGAGGANAHVVLEEYRAEDRPAADTGPAVVVLSARTKERLLAYARSLRAFLDRATTGSVDDPATAPAARSLAELCDLLRDMVAELLDVDPAEISPDTPRTELGFDHIAQARLLEQIDRQLGVVLSVGDLDRCLTTDALAEHLHRIGAAVADPAPPRHAVRLADVAHTLQIGRIALDERLAVVAKDVPELITELDHFLDGVASERLHQSNIRSGDAVRARSLLGGTAGVRFVRDLLDARDLGTVAEAWVCGLEVDWRVLYRGGAPARISLPTYPFARERYWITDEFAALGKSASATPTPTADGLWVPALAAPVAEHVADRPSPEQVRTALAGFVEHERVSAELGRICAVALLATLREMGPFPRPGERVDRARLRDDLGIVPQHHRFFDGLIDILRTEDLLIVDGDLITMSSGTASAIGPAELERRCERLIADAEDAEAPLRVLRSCLAGYPDLLTGRRTAGEVLFPGGSFDAIDDMSRSQRESAALVARAVRAYVADRLRLDPDDRISVLEVGAGVGATTTAVAEAIAEFGARVSYVCTDGSAAFARYGAGRLATRFPFLRFQELDIEHPPVGQGYPARGFDVVLAGNALHGTTDIQLALGHVKSLLRGNGLLVFAETTRDHPLPTLVLGLTPGWWAAQDDRPLAHSPLLTVPAWRTAVERAGFRTVRVLSPQPVAEKLLPEAVFLAESDAVVPDALLIAPMTVPSTAAEPEPENDELSDTEAMVLAAWQEVLGVPSLSRDVDFTELGGDSIMRTRVMSRLRARFPFELELAGLLEASTIGEMARFVETELIEKIDALSDDAARALATE